MNGEFLRLVESIHKDKGIDREFLFAAVEQGVASAARKRLGGEEVKVAIDRNTGRIYAFGADGKMVNVADLGRIAARTAYQVMTQRIREAESIVLFDEYQSKVGHVVAGSVQRFERGEMIVTLERAEAVLPRAEQVSAESYRVGDHIRAYLLDIDRQRSKVRLVLSRTREEFVRELFRMEVPEIEEGAVVIRRLAREPGHRTKVAVESTEQRVDPVGACVGVRGSRIRSIVDELHGEHIDIVPYSPDTRQFIINALQPARVLSLDYDEAAKRAVVLVPKDDLSRAIGRRGQNVRLIGRLLGCGIDVSAAEDAAQEAAQAAVAAAAAAEAATDEENQPADASQQAAGPADGATNNSSEAKEQT